MRLAELTESGGGILVYDDGSIIVSNFDTFLGDDEIPLLLPTGNGIVPWEMENLTLIEKYPTSNIIKELPLPLDIVWDKYNDLVQIFNDPIEGMVYTIQYNGDEIIKAVCPFDW